MVTKVFRISDMHCSSCVMRLESIEDELPGIKKISASYRSQMMKVEFDEAQVSEELIIEAIKEKGFTPVMEAKG